MKLYVEIPFFILIFAFMLSDPVTINLIVYRTCYLTLNYNRTECALLGSGLHDNTTKKIEAEVQPYVTVLKTTKYLTETVISAILCFFLGPWSDKYGRRPVMLFTLGGYTLGYVITTVISALPNVSPWYLFLSAIPIFSFGGFPAFLTVTICYIADTTTQENRGVRMGIFEVVLTTAVVLGTFSSSFIFSAFGYLTVYSITTFCIFTSWLCVVLGIPESVTNPETQDIFRNLFRFSLIPETVQATFKRRNGNDRKLLLIILALMVIFMLVTTADGNIVFLYLRRKLNWSLRKYTLYSAGRNLAWIAGSIVGCYILHKLLNVKESILMMLGFFSVMTSALLQGLATKDWHMYLSGGSKCFGGVISPMSRSLISKIVSTEDCGKVFSFLVVTETFVDVMGQSSYTYLYNATILTVPGAFNFITAGIYIFEILFTIPAIMLQIYRHRIGYETLNGENIIN